MSTTSLRAGEVMDRSAALMNDPSKTDYTYVAQLPYLNMAIDELQEHLEESNASPTNIVSAVISIPAGKNKITPIEDTTPGQPHYPIDLVEIQSIGERTAGTSNSFIPLGRREFISQYPATSSLLVWSWEDQTIKFNPNGAINANEVELKYVRQPLLMATDENSVIGTINARSYLGFKTAALCAMFIGENETRAQVLNTQADNSLERILNINSKGRQEMVTRRQPFRRSFKARGQWR